MNDRYFEKIERKKRLFWLLSFSRHSERLTYPWYLHLGDPWMK